MSQIFVITGSSNGIGKALALKVKRENHYCVGISKSKSPDVLDQQFIQDLSRISELENLVEALELPEGNQPVWLVNNAGILKPVGQTGKLKNNEIESHLKTNLIAPMVLTNSFIAKFGIKRMNILNISSGAATRPYDGWGSYCTSKAGLEMFSRVLIQEQVNMRVLSISPGTVDTSMQKFIREETMVEEFPMRDKFVNLHNKKLLKTSDDVAEKIYSVIINKEKSGILDLRYI